jgi:hypothetical protein
MSEADMLAYLQSLNREGAGKSQNQKAFREEFKKDLLVKCICECCEVLESEMIFLPSQDNVIQVRHICDRCFRGLDKNHFKNYKIFMK